MFFLVSGAAASGKSTVARLLPRLVDNIEIHDSDEKRTRTADERCAQLEEWVIEAVNRQNERVDFLLTGHSPFGELLACPSAPQLDGIVGCLLDCLDHERITRMRNRGLSPRWPPTQDVLSWGAFHRMHA